jgi:hypothetical protein
VTRRNSIKCANEIFSKISRLASRDAIPTCLVTKNIGVFIFAESFPSRFRQREGEFHFEMNECELLKRFTTATLGQHVAGVGRMQVGCDVLSIGNKLE